MDLPAQGPPLARLTDLKGKRVLIGPEGSGTEAVALRLLTASGVTRETATLINAELPTYPESFEADKADAGVLVLAPEARTVKRLFASPHASLMSLAQADAYAQRFPFFSRIELKQGVVDFANDLPANDTQMLSTTAAVVIKRDLHPALANLLAQAVIATHSQPRRDANGETQILSRAGAFPIAEDQEFPMSADALRVYKSGAPFLQRYLPYYWAVLADRLVVILLPVIGILLPTLRFAPMLYTWRVRRRILYWYKELKKIESGLTPSPTSVARASPKSIGSRARSTRSRCRSVSPTSFMTCVSTSTSCAVACWPCARCPKMRDRRGAPSCRPLRLAAVTATTNSARMVPLLVEGGCLCRPVSALADCASYRSPAARFWRPQAVSAALRRSTVPA